MQMSFRNKLIIEAENISNNLLMDLKPKEINPESSRV